MSRITQKGATGALALHASGTFQSSTDANLFTLIGTRWDLSDGREVMLVSVGETTIASAGLLVQDKSIFANHQNVAVASFTAYSSTNNVAASAVVTLGATAVFANQYQNGFAIINAGPGVGQTLKIASHNAVAASGTVAIVFEDSPNTALTTASKVSLFPPHGSNVVVNPTAPLGALAGISLYPLASGTTATPNFGFVTTKGLTAGMSDAIVATVGQSVAPSLSVVGATTQGVGTAAVIGYAAQTAVSAEARAIFVNL